MWRAFPQVHSGPLLWGAGPSKEPGSCTWWSQKIVSGGRKGGWGVGINCLRPIVPCSDFSSIAQLVKFTSLRFERHTRPFSSTKSIQGNCVFQSLSPPECTLYSQLSSLWLVLLALPESIHLPGFPQWVTGYKQERKGVKNQCSP